MIAQLLLAATLSVTSNVDTVRGWYREHLTYDSAAGRFSKSEFPSAAEAQGAALVAQSIPRILEESLENLASNLAPVAAAIDEWKAKPVVMLASAVEPENAIDRRNLTMVCISNVVERSGSNATVTAWVYGNNVLASPPIVKARLATELGTTVSWLPCTWYRYGDASYKEELSYRGETYETYRLTVQLSGIPTNLPVRLRPWVKIGDPEKGFDYGNRQLRVNNVLCCTTNDASFLGVFCTTNGVAITNLVPYVDRGELRFAEPETSDEE